MAVSFPRDLPNLSDVVSIAPKFETKVGITTGEFTFDTQIQKYKGQRWQVTYTLVPMPRDKANVWIAWLASLNGKEKSFLSPLSHLTSSEGSASANTAPTVNGASQTGNTLAMTGAPVSETNYFKAGDFLQLQANGDDARVYMVLQDVSTDGGGAVTADIWPDLYTSPTNGSTVTVLNPRGAFKLNQNVTEYMINNAGEYLQLRFTAFSVV